MTPLRRRLWELPAPCHAAVIGSTWTVAELRELTDRLFGGRSSFGDFALWTGTLSQCAARNKLSETLQRELQRRHADTLRRFASTADARSLAALWSAALRDGAAAGASWAVLCHPYCDEMLQTRVLQDLQLLRHQRVALQQREAAALVECRALIDALRSDAARTVQRHALRREQVLAERDALRRELAALRARLLAQQGLIDRLQAERREPSAPLPPQRETHVQRVAELSRELAALRPVALQAVQVPQPEAAAAVADDDANEVDDADEAAALTLSTTALRSARVLCVGGRPALVPLYRMLVQRHGGEFEHHDGGIEDSAHRLSAQLAAADLVLCQAGCLNHNAYARVKQHVKRHRKPCVFIDKPGAGSFARALVSLAA
jgi:hypothetical protein